MTQNKQIATANTPPRKRRNRNRNRRNSKTYNATPDQSGVFAIDIGEPESVLEHDITPYLGTFLHHQQEYYEPPISKTGLAKIRTANGFHSRMPLFRRDKVLNLYQVPKRNKLISRRELGVVLENLLVIGEAYVGKVRNRMGQLVGLVSMNAVFMRLKPDGSKGGYRYCYVRDGQIIQQFRDEDVIHLKQEDLLQGIYGMPEYFGAIQSILLNEAATLFRRKYFINGAHLGSLFISTSQSLKPKDEKAITEKIRQSKGVGNFRSMFLHLPSHGHKATDVFNVVPVGDVATRDEFKTIKNITDRDISAAWGTRQEVAGIAPETVGGTGDIDKLFALDYENKTLPLINFVADEINEHLPDRLALGFDVPTSLVLPGKLGVSA